MPTVSFDSAGVLRVVDERNAVLFDRLAGVKVVGWSATVAKLTHFKTCDETTGKVTGLHR